MATEEKNDELNFDDLESDTLLNTDNLLDNDELNDLDDFGDLQELDLDGDFDLGLDETEETSSEIDSETTTFDETEPEQDSSEIEQAPATDDVIDIDQNLDSPNEDSEDALSDDDLDLSLEASFDEQEASQESEETPVTADISEEDVANFDATQFDAQQDEQEVDFDLDQLQEQDESDIVTDEEDLADNTLTFDSDVEYSEDIDDDDDDDDDDDYGVDLKIGPVTIEFTQVIEPEDDNASLTEDDSANTEIEIPEEIDSNLEDVAVSEDENQDLELDSELPVEENNDVPEQEENCDINNDEELEFEVTQDDSLNNIDIDNVFDNQQDDNLLNISISKPKKMEIDEETNNFLSDEVEDSDQMLGLVDSEGGLNEEPIQEESAIEQDVVLPEGNELDDVANIEDNLISDDDLNALDFESDNVVTETTEPDEEITDAVLAEDIVVEQESDENLDEEKISLDGNEDLGIDLDAQDTETVAKQEDTIEYDNIDDNTTAMTEEVELPATEPQEANTLDEDICADVNIDEEVDETDDDVNGLEITDELPESSEIVMSELDNANCGITNEDNIVNVDIDDISAPNLTDNDDEDETIGVSSEELDDILTSNDLNEVPVEQDEELTDAEREQLVAMPDDPSFENNDSILSDEELAESVTIDGEPVPDNDILNNGDLDNYNDIPLPEELSDENAELGIAENVESTEQEEQFNLDETDDDESIGVSEEVMSEITSQIEEAQAEESKESLKTEELKQDVKGVLTYLDKLLDSLPEEKIKEFAESKEFEIYRKLFEELDIKH